MDKNTGFLNYIDYFRAIAIIDVVTAHTLCWGSGKVYNTAWYIFGSAVYFFIFMAGFLFQKNGFKSDLKQFYLNKIKLLICPYLFYTIPTALYFSLNTPAKNALADLSFIEKFTITLTNGFIINPPIWFLLMIFILFLFTPIFFYIKNKNNKLFLFLTLISLVLCIIFPRGTHKLFSDYTYTTHLSFTIMTAKFYLKNIIHFTFFFLFGMLTHSFITKYPDYIRNHARHIIIYTLDFILLYYAYSVFVMKEILLKESIPSILQIILLMTLLIVFENRIKNNQILHNVLHFCSQYSFGIFFIHFLIINCIYFHSIYFQNMCSIVDVWDNTFICFAKSFCIFWITLLGSISILWILKKIFNLLKIKNTKLIIGV